MNYLFFVRKVTALAIFYGFAAGAYAAETDPDGQRYLPSPDAVSDVETALVHAAETGRHALVVLGANWCHDSRALAARLYRPPLADVIQEHYELVFVDVGFLDKGGAVLESVGVPQFYATPTVLIVDPSNGRVINEEDRHIWGNAYNISMASSVRYFEKWATNDAIADPAMDSAKLRELNAEIDRFEQQQAERVAAGYAVVGPMLAAYKAGNSPPEFDASWDELRDFRIAIPGDIRELREEAKRRVSEGDADVQLEYPEYPRLSWETE